MAYAIKHRGQITAASGLDVLAGLWLLFSPFVLHFPHAVGAISNAVVFGILITLTALFRTFHPRGDSVGASWLNVLLGLWVIISPWVLGYSSYHTATLNSVILGIIVVILALWSGLATDTANTNAAASNIAASPPDSRQP